MARRHDKQTEVRRHVYGMLADELIATYDVGGFDLEYEAGELGVGVARVRREILRQIADLHKKSIRP